MTQRIKSVVSPNTVFRYINDRAKTWFMDKKGMWNSCITIGGVDIQEYGSSKENAIHNLVNKILNDRFLMANLPDNAVLPEK
jgi:hypothetical protein